MRRFVLTVAACLISNAAIAIEKPSNAVAVLATADKRIDWWAKNFPRGSANPARNCNFQQGDAGFELPCRKTFGDDEIIKGEERSEFGDNSPEMRKYRLNRTSLYITPLPMVPASAVRAEMRQLFSLEKFKATISAATFDRSSLSIVELFQYQWGWNISYEAVAINEYLKAGWDYWERAANQNAIYCDKALAQSDYQRECVAVIRLRTTKSSWEPVGFERGIAVCYTDRQRLFYVGCSLVTMETRRRQYVKAYVGPPMGMGGGAFVNDIGMFRLTCDFKVGAVNDKLAAVKRHFEFGGQYSLGKALQINAPTGFRLFASGGVTRWGIVVMQAKADASETRITFTFVGRWGTQNVNDDNWPVFKDPDVEIFKRMFEEVVGRNTCNKDAAPSIPMMTQS